MFKPVLVTGASSGIGEATAVYLAHKGFRVFAAARRAAALETLSGMGAGRIHPVTLDVTDEASIAEATATIAEEAGGPLYGLVNNAGVAVAGPVEQVPGEEWRRQFETNVIGLVQMTQAILPQMRAANQGRIINIGSVAGRIVAPFMGPYGASKHAVEGVTDALRRELVGTGLRVSLIRPGFINTHFGEQEQDSLARYMGEDSPYRDHLHKFAKWHERKHPSAAPATVVAEAVHKALTAARPHSRYTVPSSFLGFLALRNLMPSAVVDRVFGRITGVE
ncbi:MAG: SDR family oxidoreductase [Pseudomonadota bacterium]